MIRTVSTIVVSVVLTVAVIGAAAMYLFEAYKPQLAAELLAVTDAAQINALVEQRSTDNEQIIDVIAEVNPSVVSVVITKDIPIFERFLEEVPFGFFGSVLVPRVRQSGTEAVEVGGGSGFIVTSSGRIVTNRHVVDDIDASYSILTNDGTSYPVRVVAKDPVLDIAVLQITSELSEPLPALSFAAADDIALGETVIAIGNALAEFRNSVSVGVVSGLSRTIVAGDRNGMAEELENVIQTDAAINPGNSGGPLINLNGEVVGVNVAASVEAENIGFALPASVVEEVVEVLVQE